MRNIEVMEYSPSDASNINASDQPVPERGERINWAICATEPREDRRQLEVCDAVPFPPNRVLDVVPLQGEKTDERSQRVVDLFSSRKRKVSYVTLLIRSLVALFEIFSRFFKNVLQDRTFSHMHLRSSDLNKAATDDNSSRLIRPSYDDVFVNTDTAWKRWRGRDNLQHLDARLHGITGSQTTREKLRENLP